MLTFALFIIIKLFPFLSLTQLVEANNPLLDLLKVFHCLVIVVLSVPPSACSWSNVGSLNNLKNYENMKNVYYIVWSRQTLYFMCDGIPCDLRYE